MSYRETELVAPIFQRQAEHRADCDGGAHAASMTGGRWAKSRSMERARSSPD
jgi:hypothetical protein